MKLDVWDNMEFALEWCLITSAVPGYQRTPSNHVPFSSGDGTFPMRANSWGFLSPYWAQSPRLSKCSLPWTVV